MAKRLFYNMSDLNTLARGYTEDCIEILAKIMQAEETPPAARVRAAELLLLRGWGQPQMHVADMLLEARTIDRIVREIVYMPPTPGESVMEITTPDDDTVILPWTGGNGRGDGNGGDTH